MTRIPLRLALMIACVFAPALSHAQNFRYTVEQLGALPGETSAIPFDINSRGQVVGWSGNARAFVFTDGNGMVELFGPTGRPSTVARGINDAGIIVGEAWGSGAPLHAVRWSGGPAEDLGALGTTSRAWDINATGLVVGVTPADALNTGAFIFDDGNGFFLLAPARDYSVAYDVNDAGVVTGYMTAPGGYHAYRFSPDGELQDLGTTGGFAHNFGKAINISGQVAGTLHSASGNSERVFRYTDGLGMIQLGGVGQTNDVWGMNSRGDFVGRGQPTAGLLRAFIYTNEHGLEDLTTLIDPALNLRLFYAHDINDAGQIVGLAHNYVTGASVAYRLTPTIPVGAFAALAVSPVSIEATSPCTGWVTLTTPAPAGGATLFLSSSSVSAQVPGSVTIPEGTRHASFPITTTHVPALATVQITAQYLAQLRTTQLDILPAAPTGIDDRTPAMAVRVFPAAPNPTGQSAAFRYELMQASEVKVSVYDVAGRLVRSLVDAKQEARLHSAVWDGRDHSGRSAPSGVYFFRIQAGTFRDNVKLVLVR